MMLPRGSCAVFFDDHQVVVTTTHSGLLTWHVVLDAGAPDPELGENVAVAFDRYELGDPDAPSHEEFDTSWAPVCALFGVEHRSQIRRITVNSRNSNVWFVPSEWKIDNRMHLGRDSQIELPAEYDLEAIGQGVREAMRRTLS